MLGVCSVCARCSLDLSRRTYNEYPACAPRVSSVGPTCSAHVWRLSGVYIHAPSFAHIFVHAKNPDAHSEANDDECIALVQRARVTNADAHPANGNALAKIATFSVPGPCIVHV